MQPKCDNSNSKLILTNIFERNPKLFIDLVSKYYSLNEKLIEKYESKLNWINLSESGAIKWSEEIIIKFFNRYTVTKTHVKYIDQR
jgi:hypothetical protein